jgi:hypothetical protein
LVKHLPSLYSNNCREIGINLSEQMPQKARHRVARRRLLVATKFSEI